MAFSLHRSSRKETRIMFPTFSLWCLTFLRQVAARKRTRTCPAFYRPRLEALEDRWCPSCTLGLRNGVLSIVGDRASNAVAVQDQGTAGVFVFCDGKDGIRFTDVRSINAQLDGGDDRLDYLAASPDITPFPRSLTVDLGDGNDILNVTIGNPDIRVPTPQLNVTAYGGKGNDNMTLLMQNVAIGEPNEVTFNGGAGADTLKGQLQNVKIASAYDFTFNGGAGADIINTLMNQTTFGSATGGEGAGKAEFDEFGGDGNDTFNIACVNDVIGHPNEAPAAHVVVRVSGGDGGDTFNVSFASIAVGDPGEFGRPGEPNERLRLDVSGDGGNDVANVRFVNMVWGHPDDLVAVNVLMGIGDDLANVSFGDPNLDVLNGHLVLVLDGQAGDDQLSATIYVSAASRGTINARVLGSDGDDFIIYCIAANRDLYGDPDQFFALLDGGNGFDTASFSANVTVRNVEAVR
jgi:hypothetical protein